MPSAVPRGVHGVAEADPDRVAVVCGNVRMTFRELDERANGVAQALVRLGVTAGDRVAVMMGNGAEVLAARQGVARLGAVVVPVSWRLTVPEVVYILANSGSLALLHTGGAAVEAAGDAGVAELSLAGNGFPEPQSQPPTTEWLGAPVVTMAYTSGTTGRPKGIMRAAPAAARDAPAQPFARFWGFGPRDVHLLCGPAYHTAPGAYAEMTLVEGGRVVVMERFDAVACLELIQSERVTTSHMVPANFIRILQAPWQDYDLTSVVKILHAAAPCPVAVKRKIMEVFPPGAVWEYYGASEGMVSVIGPDEWMDRPGSVGRAFPGIEIRVMDDGGQERMPGVVGQVYASAFGTPFVYHDDPDKTAAAWRDGMFTAGDLGYLDADGYLFLSDRRSDLIISGGVNIYPAEVEGALLEDPDVVDACVIGLPDESMGSRVHAILELAAGAPMDVDALVRRLRERLAGFKCPRTVELVDELPREPNGKVLKRKLIEERASLARERTPPGDGGL